MRRLPAALTTTTAALALALTGCGSDGDTDPAAGSGDASASASPSQSPSESAEESPSESPEASGSSGGDSAAQQEYVDLVQQAAEEEDTSVRTRVVSTVDTPQGPLETVVRGVTQVEDGELSARLDTELPQSAGGGTLQTLIVDGVFYVQAPGIPQGKYARVDLAEAGGQIGEQLQQQIDQIDPRAQAEATIASVQSVEKLGESRVNGADVTRFRVVQDFREFADAQQNPLYDQLLASGAAPEQLTSVVAIDDDGRVRRTTADLEVQGTSVRTVADFLAYDVDVDITAPAQRDVVEQPTG
ncbi:hypothetical protein KLP28_02770 [Nocardioidaceae bacterium]|nr:hypothetical protein KLP28_02770 [Nocardioidaceae bacterium]